HLRPGDGERRPRRGRRRHMGAGAGLVEQAGTRRGGGKPRLGEEAARNVRGAGCRAAAQSGSRPLQPDFLSDMMSERIACFVMSGGVGSRLWPLSREDNPKQFHDLSGDGSMLAKTLRRMTGRTAGAAPVFLIASERHAGRVHGDINGIDLAGGGVLFEPVGRNTAAAVALATLRALADFGDSLILVVPSDHEISTTAQFWQTVEQGVP